MTPRQEEARRLALSGLLNTEIAVQLGITRQSVHELLKATGTPSNSHHKPNKYDADVIRLYDMGWSQADIARELGIRQQLASRIMVRLGLRTQHIPIASDEQIVGLYQDGMSYRDIASNLKLSHGLVWRTLHRMNVPMRSGEFDRCLNQTQIDDVVTQSRDGVTVKTLAKSFNCSESTITRIRKQYGVQHHKPKAKQ